MNPSSGYFTPCRTVGLRRVSKKTPVSGSRPTTTSQSTSTAAEPAKTPFRSPCLLWEGTVEPVRPSPWSTPQLRRRQLKMGLSKVFKKKHSSDLLEVPSTPEVVGTSVPVASADSCEERVENGFLGFDAHNDEMCAEADERRRLFHKLVFCKTDTTISSISERDNAEQVHTQTGDFHELRNTREKTENSDSAFRENTEIFPITSKRQSFNGELKVNDGTQKGGTGIPQQQQPEQPNSSDCSLLTKTERWTLEEEGESQLCRVDSPHIFPENPKTYERQFTKNMDNGLVAIDSNQARLQPLRPDYPIHYNPSQGDYTCRGYPKLTMSESWSEMEEFKKLNEDVRKWLAGARRAISDIIDEVRCLKGKHLTVTELMDDLRIDPKTVGYDSENLEEFVSLKKFLLSHDALF